MHATLTVLFTDAVASTEALARLGDERFGVVQASHLDHLRVAAQAHEGREVKSLGDGLMVVFTGAADALACAVAMQQAVEMADRRGEDGLPLRVGVALGDVTIDDDGDCHGTAVVEAARLCAAAAAGQVLATETVRAVAGSRGGHAFTSRGAVELKGLPEPVPVVEVGWAPVADADAPAPVPLPPLFAVETPWTFVGRDAEVERLDRAWREVLDGSRQVALLGGEPGVGKTRLAREIAVRAHAQGALVLFGRVDEDLEIAYQPFAEALRGLLVAVPEARRDAVLALRGGVLVRLVPDLAGDAPREAQSAVDAWVLFEAIVDWLADEASARPVVLVLDDLQWAAKPTVLALMHLVRSERLHRVLIVGTYRDTELDRRHPFAAALADLRRETGVERVTVGGLDGDGVAAFVEAARGDALDQQARDLATTLTEQTRGNPFFVGEVLRSLVESGAVAQVEGAWVATAPAGGFDVPDGVREVVGRRLGRLEPATSGLLTVAAVAGPQFDLSVVSEVVGAAVADALDAADAAVASGLIVETGMPGHLAFAHALVRQTLEADLTTMRRAHLHRELGLAIERRSAHDPEHSLELAHHFAEAVGEGERAARYAAAAAAQAIERLAFERAVDLLQRAMDVLPAAADPAGLLRMDLQMTLHTCYLKLYDTQRAMANARAMFAAADAAGDDVGRLTAAGMICNGMFVSSSPDPRDADAMAAALRIDVSGLPGGERVGHGPLGDVRTFNPAGTRARLLYGVGSLEVWGLELAACVAAVPHERPSDLVPEVTDLASASGDPYVVAGAHAFSAWTLMPGPDADGQLREAQTAIAMLEGRHLALTSETVVMLPALTRLGRLDDLVVAATGLLADFERVGDRVLHLFGRQQAAVEALLRGRFDEAEELAGLALAASPEEVMVQAGFALQMVAIRLEQHRPEEARQFSDLLAVGSGESPTWTVCAGAVAAAQGDTPTVQQTLEEWRARDFALPEDFSRPGWIWSLVLCAHAAGDAHAAARLYNELLPYDGQLIVVIFNFAPASAAHLLGLAAEALGDRDLARRHLEDALEFEQAIGAPPLAARTRAALTRMGSPD